jgi:hypothetical protein
MAEQDFPDELPPEYSARYGSGRLHDTKGPELHEWMIKETRSYAVGAIAALKEQIQDVWQFT